MLWHATQFLRSLRFLNTGNLMRQWAWRRQWYSASHIRHRRPIRLANENESTLAERAIGECIETESVAMNHLIIFTHRFIFQE